jgi:hypothetical protein
MPSRRTWIRRSRSGRELPPDIRQFRNRFERALHKTQSAPAIMNYSFNNDRGMGTWCRVDYVKLWNNSTRCWAPRNLTGSVYSIHGSYELMWMPYLRFKLHNSKNNYFRSLSVSTWDEKKKMWTSGRIFKDWNVAWVYIFNILMKGPGWAWRPVR